MRHSYYLWLVVTPLILGISTLMSPLNAQEKQWISASDEELIRATARQWNVKLQTLQIYNGTGAYADKAGGISIGTSFLQEVQANKDTALAQLLLQFTLLHELWHLHQFSDNQAADQPRVVNECIADAMASYRLTQYILAREVPATIAALTQQLELSSRLYFIPSNLPGINVDDPRKHYHLSMHQRLLAIHFGQSRASQESSDARMEFEKMPYKQLSEYASRFNLNKDQPAATGFMDICNYITRQGSKILSDLLVFENSGDIKGYGSKKMIQSNISAVKNLGKRPVRYSFIGMSGYKPTGQTTKGDILIFVDAFRSSADIAPGEEVKISSEIQFPYSQGKGKPFIWLGPLYEEALVTASYIGDEPKVSTCADSPGMVTPVLQALVRIGAASADQFKSLRGELILEIGNSGHGVYTLNISIPDARAEFLSYSNGSGFASIHFSETKSLEDASKKFNTLVAEIKKGCAPFLDALQPKLDTDGRPQFSIPRLTQSSTAFLKLTKHNAIKLSDKPTYVPVWFISPSLSTK